MEEGAYGRGSWGRDGWRGGTEGGDVQTEWRRRLMDRRGGGRGEKWREGGGRCEVVGGFWRGGGIFSTEERVTHARKDGMAEVGEEEREEVQGER